MLAYSFSTVWSLQVQKNPNKKSKNPTYKGMFVLILIHVDLKDYVGLNI